MGAEKLKLSCCNKRSRRRILINCFIKHFSVPGSEFRAEFQRYINVYSLWQIAGDRKSTV